jgi:hypothetical protein
MLLRPTLMLPLLSSSCSCVETSHSDDVDVDAGHAASSKMFWLRSKDYLSLCLIGFQLNVPSLTSCLLIFLNIRYSNLNNT